MPSVKIAPDYRNRAAPAESAWAEQALHGSMIATAPFPHCLVRNFLPEPLFVALRETFPRSDDGLQPVHRRRRDTGYSDKRFSLPLPPPAADESAALPAPIRALQQVLTCDRIMMALLDRFADVIGPRLAELQASTGLSYIPIRTSIELIYDRTGFELAPHTDSAAKLVTGLLYLADADDPHGLGTRLYAPIDPGLRSDGRTPVDRSRLHEATLAPYEPNLFLCFPRSDQSLHGVDATMDDRPRRLVQYSIMVV